MKYDNKGLTLLELLISVGILTIVSAMILGFLTSGAHTSRSVSFEAKLQYESQMAMAQLQEYLIDCNGGVCFDASTKTLYIVNVEEDAGGNLSYTLQTVQLQNDSLVYDKQAIDTQHSPGYYTIDSSSYQPDIMASYVSQFSVSATTSASSSLSRAKVTLGFSGGGRAYETSQDIALRNPVYVRNTVDALVQAVIP